MLFCLKNFIVKKWGFKALFYRFSSHFVVKIIFSSFVLLKFYFIFLKG